MLIRERVERVLREQLGLGYEWDDDTSLTADVNNGLALDSIDLTELVMGLEEEFSIRIPDDLCDGMDRMTVGGLADWLEPQLATKHALFT
jgi:acyl carrier protein